MKIKKPNIHIFVEHKKYYLYDVNINAVVTIPYELYEFFSLWGKEDEKEITADIEEFWRKRYNHECKLWTECDAL